ncbi:Pentatricopeptide repeat [Dillenia turbinata]|uniref:Pentatricopeptide repeat n=1 Tax=Dillenia turbinata TaxID=194707 RepID=A0AAN8VGZ1_9MAGN
MCLNNFITRTSSYYYIARQTQTHHHVLNSKIKSLIQRGHYSEALQLHANHPHFPLYTHSDTFPLLLKACAALSHLPYGRRLHSNIISLGLHSDPFIATSLVSMYVKSGSLGSASQLFVKMSERASEDVTLWNSIVDGYFRYGCIPEGIAQFRQMLSLGIKPDAFSLTILLRTCACHLGFTRGKQIHAYVMRNITYSDPFLDTALIDMYSSCGHPMIALHVFNMKENKNNVVAWNAMITGFCDNGLWTRSMELFSLAKIEGCKLASTSFSGALTACSRDEDNVFGRQVHCDVIKLGFQRDLYVSTSLLTMYAKSRLLQDAQCVFHEMLCKEIETWNAMISACVANGCYYDAFDVYNEMRSNAFPSDEFTTTILLSACSMMGYHIGRAIHGDIIKKPMHENIAVQSALLTMYSKCQEIEDARSIFITMRERDIVSWGSIISGFCQNGKYMEVVDYYRKMEADNVKPDSDILASAIAASMGLGSVSLGCEIHGYAIRSGQGSDAFVGTSLIDMYSKCGLPEMAEKVFYDMPHRNLVAWNCIISCFSHNGLPERSIILFPQILEHGLSPDSVSITSVLAAISSTAALLKGKTIHGFQIRHGVWFDPQVENALIDMYIKCGNLRYAHHIFQNMSEKNTVTWNSIISGYGLHGKCLEAIRLFEEMKASGITPDDITFLSLISSCSHCGLVENGLKLFQSMSRDYGISPKMEHYVNIVDLLGRAGCLNDAYRFIQRMPMEPERSIWLCLLSACRTFHNIELGELATTNLLKLEPTRGSNYVQLLNMYGEAESWDRIPKLRVLIKEKGLKKSPGCSWIEVRSRVDIFFSGDSSSPRAVEIYDTLQNLWNNMEVRKQSALNTKFKSEDATCVVQC